MGHHKYTSLLWTDSLKHGLHWLDAQPWVILLGYYPATGSSLWKLSCSTLLKTASHVVHSVSFVVVSNFLFTEFSLLFVEMNCQNCWYWLQSTYSNVPPPTWSRSVAYCVYCFFASNVWEWEKLCVAVTVYWLNAHKACRFLSCCNQQDCNQHRCWGGYFCPNIQINNQTMRGSFLFKLLHLVTHKNMKRITMWI